MSDLRSRRIDVAVSSDDAWSVDDVMLARGLGDGLPVVAPTEARVAHFVDAIGQDPAQPVVAIPPRMGLATIEKLAVNAVMAGCRPEHFPVVRAAVEAFVSPDFNGRIIQATSNPAGVLILVNGPGREELGVNFGANCLGQGSRANLTIGRALRLILMNIGGGTVGLVDKAPHGFPGKVSLCFGEDEVANPWTALHVERGFLPDENVVTVFAAHGTSNIVIHGRLGAADVLPELAYGMVSSGASNFAQGALGSPMLVLTPNVARALAADGVTKEALRAYLFEHARVPLEWYPPSARRSGDLDDRAIDGQVPISESSDNISIVVAGSTGTHATFIPTYADSIPSSSRFALLTPT